MRASNLLGEFLRARRELREPGKEVLLPGERRRVSGLRREEVAMLAGVSRDYYTRLEQGRERHPSPAVVNSLARVLGLDDDARLHLHELVTSEPGRRPSAGEAHGRPTAGLMKLLAAWPDTPAFVVDAHCNVLACTALAAVVHPGLARDSNMMRLLFLDSQERAMYLDWDQVAPESVAWLRASAGADLNNPDLTMLLDGLISGSNEFASLWDRHDVRIRSGGVKRLRHPVVGELALNFETLTVNASPGHSVIVYHPEPGSNTERALKLLESGPSARRRRLPDGRVPSGTRPSVAQTCDAPASADGHQDLNGAGRPTARTPCP